MTANSYSFDLTPSTNSSGNVSLPALGGIMILTGMLLASVPNETGIGPRSVRYALPFDGTFSQHQNVFTGDYAHQTALDFESSMTKFYASLLEQQERLGDDFERALYNNLWDLYDT